MHRWHEQFETALTRLLPDGQPVLAAVSGGVDSMVLLHAIHALAPRHGWDLIAAHFNHQLRGESSDADEQLVRNAAHLLGIPFVVGRGDVKTAARTGKLSLEMAARQLRHEFLAQSARNQKLRTVAVAHHAGDQVELFFLRLFRGAGSTGMAGMRPSSPLPCDPHIQLIRPLLGHTKEALRAIAVEQQIPFSEDATNACLDIQRNRIRHELIPLLEKQYQPGLSRTIPRLMEILGAEADAITTAARSWLAAPAQSPFSELPVAVQRLCLQIQLYDLRQQPDFAMIEWLRLNPDQEIALDPRFSALRDAAGTVRLISQDRKAPDAIDPAPLSVSLTPTGTAEFAGLKVSWILADESGRQFEPIRGEYFDANRVGAQITLRFWQPGDRFQPIGTPTPAKLQDLFTNLKVPKAERHRRVVAVAATGEIFWVEGLRISERFRLDKSTIKRLKWEWCR